METQVNMFISNDDSYLYYDAINADNNAIIWRYYTADQPPANQNRSTWVRSSVMDRHESYIRISNTHVFTMGLHRSAQKLYMITTEFGGSHQWANSRDCQSSSCTVYGGKAVLEGSLIHTAVSMNDDKNIVM